MTTNIRPILLTHIVTLIIAADKDAVVTMTVMFRPNDDNKSGKSHSVQITGSHEEIAQSEPRSYMARSVLLGARSVTCMIVGSTVWLGSEL